MSLPQSYFDKVRSDYQRRRDLFLPYLRDAGFAFHVPDGAYYVMTDVASLGGRNDHDFVRAMIRDVGVSAVPGSSFYSPQDEGRTKVRFMFAKRDETLHEAGKRLLQLREKIRLT